MADLHKVQRNHQVEITRVESFSAAHRLHSVHLSDEDNRELYGPCNNENGHGHNYKVEVSLKGTVNNQNGMVMNISVLKKQIQTVLKNLDHKHIDKDVPYFKETVSTAENIAIYIWEKLKEELHEEHRSLLCKVKLYETEKNIAIYRGDTVYHRVV